MARVIVPKFKSSRVLKGMLALSGALLAVACKSGGGSVSSGGGSQNVTGTLTNITPYPTSAGSNWTPIISSSRYYIKGLSLTIQGSCTLGIATIKFNEGGPDYAETASCNASGTFTFTKSNYGAGGQPTEGDKTIHMTGLDVSGAAISGATASVDVRIDNTAPPVANPPTTNPSVATSSMSPYQYNNSSAGYDITGTVSTANGDAVRMTGPGGVNVPLTAGAFTYHVTLVNGGTLQFDFIVFDQAGNQTPFSVFIQWAPNISLAYSSMTSGGFNMTTSSNSTIEMESAVFNFNNTEADLHGADAPTPVTLQTGPNSITNEARNY